MMEFPVEAAPGFSVFFQSEWLEHGFESERINLAMVGLAVHVDCRSLGFSQPGLL